MSRTCELEGCDAKHYARGRCKRHYRRLPDQQDYERGRSSGRTRSPGLERKRNQKRSAYRTAWKQRQSMPRWAAWWEARRRREDWRGLLRPATGRGAVRLSQRPTTRRFIGRTCQACGATWVSYAARDDTTYCSPCNEKRWRNDGRHKRRAWKAAASVYEVISPDEVFARDGYRCQLCGRSTRGKRFPHPWSPTVDHIVPLARGGCHSIANVQTACHRCNSRKGIRAANDQLRLST